MKHESISAGTADDLAPTLAIVQLDAEPTDGAELGRLRKLVERQYRLNRVLTSMLADSRPEGTQIKHVEIAPRGLAAHWMTRPQLTARSGAQFWSGTADAPPRSLQAPPGYECHSLGGATGETIGVLVFGLSGADLDNVVQSVADDQRKTRSFLPVFITDQSDFRAFVTRGYAFEYLRRERAFGGRDGDPVQALVAQYSKKWGFTRTLDRSNARALDREYPPLALVTKHNADMSRACHSERFGWIAETLRIAMATERYDAVGPLADYLLAWYDRIPQATQIPAAKALCRKFLAFGEVDELKRFLFKNYTRVNSDDFLFTLFSTYCTASGSFVSTMATLPSGKLNSFYISKRTEVAGDETLSTFLSATEATAPNINFLLANHFAMRGDREPYRMFVNRGLTRSVRTQLRRTPLGGPNVLAGFEFERPVSVKHSPDLVSVIMSAHNSATTLRYAAKSILEQSYRNLELLICDDDPDNLCLAALGPLASDPRVRLFRSNKSQGTYNIRNNMLRHARGNLVTFHDSDDLAFPDRIENQVNYLRQNDVAGVCGQWYRVSMDGRFVFSSEHSVARLAVVSLMAPKYIFDASGPYRSAKFGADTEYYEGLRLRFGAAAVPIMQQPLIFGLSSETSLTRRAGMEATEDGYRSAARRAYAATAARSRLISWEAAREQDNQALVDAEILVPDAGVSEELG
jgi:hypothetical protein